MTFVPIPYMENDQEYIFDIDARCVFTQNETLKIVTKDDLKHCINIDDFTMCSSMLAEVLQSVDSIGFYEHLFNKQIFNSFPYFLNAQSPLFNRLTNIFTI